MLPTVLRALLLATLFPATSLPATSLPVLAAADKPVRKDVLPKDVALPGRPVLLRLHAEGMQIYECRRGVDGTSAGPSAGPSTSTSAGSSAGSSAGTLAWAFREPLAALLRDGRTIGHHYAGPTWVMEDGSSITAKVAAEAPGATPADIPLLRLDVTAHSGEGALSAVSAVQRLATRGGVAAGPCATAGTLRLEPYGADYVFLGR